MCVAYMQTLWNFSSVIWASVGLGICGGVLEPSPENTEGGQAIYNLKREMSCLILQNVSQFLHSATANTMLISEYFQNYEFEHKENKKMDAQSCGYFIMREPTAPALRRRIWQVN